jgi:hypothetical protein
MPARLIESVGRLSFRLQKAGNDCTRQVSTLERGLDIIQTCRLSACTSGYTASLWGPCTNRSHLGMSLNGS